MNALTKFSIVLLVIAALAVGGIFALKTTRPPYLAASNPQLDSLRISKASLVEFSEARTAEITGKETTLRKQLWTPATFAYWRKNNVPEGWQVQDLGPAETKLTKGKRYAFQRPQAADKHWPEFTELMGKLEAHECVSIANVALANKTGFAGSRQFSQCVLVAIFYFSDDDAAKTP